MGTQTRKGSSGRHILGMSWGYGWHGKRNERLVNEKAPVLSWSYKDLLKGLDVFPSPPS